MEDGSAGASMTVRSGTTAPCAVRIFPRRSGTSSGCGGEDGEMNNDTAHFDKHRRAVESER